MIQPYPDRRSGVMIDRREFARWLASLAAMFCSSTAFAQTRDAAIFLRPGDPYSDPKRLRKRYDRGGVDIPRDNMVGRALEWRILADPYAAGFSLGDLLKSAWHSSSDWEEVAQFVMTADWLSTYQRFTPAMKNHLGDLLLRNAETLFPLIGAGDPGGSPFQNISVRWLTSCMFASMGGARLAPDNPRVAPLRLVLDRSLRNLMEQMQFVVPDASSHESMDYMRLTYAPLAMVSELRRTLLRDDTAEQISTFANMGQSYLYKLLPDGTFSREGDCENPSFDGYDPMILGYAAHRFQDHYAAWILRNTEGMPPWAIPAMRFLWDDPYFSDADPFKASLKDLHLAKHFRGVDQIVFRNGFSARNTRIEFDCGPYFAKHQHLDRNHFTIHHRGHLAIDSGAGYRHSESPHYLNYYRRTVAHNTMLVFDPAEKFFWGDHAAAAANDGGQRMDSARYWDTIRSVDDWQKTRDLWDIGHLRNVETADPRYMYATGDATKAYSAGKLTKFTRELLYFPSHDVLFIYDDVQATKPEFRKTWLLHTVSEPEFLTAAPTPSAPSATRAAASAPTEPRTSLLVTDREGEMRVHTFLPERCDVIKRGGPGQEFWTPGNAAGGDWGSGRNWPMEPAEGGPLPKDPEEVALWKAFYGAGFAKLAPSNRKDVEPGSWRLEVTPSDPAKEHVFLHGFEIGDRGKTGRTAPCAYTVPESKAHSADGW